MKNICFIIPIVLLLVGCRSYPANFTPIYDGQHTGLDSFINIEGYYVSPQGCDSSFYSMYMFYPDGLFTIATVSAVHPELVKCFENGGQSAACNYPIWGIYRVDGDVIKTQVIRPEGGGCVIFRDYKILPDGQIVNVSDYLQPQYTRLGYMANYPSFQDNPCKQPADFFPLKQRRNKEDCPYLKKKWFWRKSK